MQIRRLQGCVLFKATKTRQSNGAVVNTYEMVDDYRVIVQPLTDEVSASIYGADVNKTYRVSSPHGRLEKFLLSKLNNQSDNISSYYIGIGEIKYEIITVKSDWADIKII